MLIAPATSTLAFLAEAPSDGSEILLIHLPGQYLMLFLSARVFSMKRDSAGYDQLWEKVLSWIHLKTAG
jgi:hypothetical protein